MIVAGVISALLMLAGIEVLLLDSRIQHLSITAPAAPTGETWLIVGSDSRAAIPAGTSQSAFGTTADVGGARADIVIVVHRTAGGRVYNFSVPRDMLVHNQAGQLNRLALTYQVSPQNMVDSLCTTLGIPVHHVVVVDFAAFAAVVDDLGGVRVQIPHPVRDTLSGLDLPVAGSLLLNGEQALALVRSRHPEQLIDGRWVATADGAEQRTSWAGRIFTSIEQTASSANPLVLQRLAWTVSGSTRTDQDTSLADLGELALSGGPILDLPATPISGGLAVSPSDKTYAALASAGFSRTCG